MSKIYYTDTCPFRFADWMQPKVEKLFAGRDCVMAITDHGQVLQKVTDPSLAESVSDWQGIRDVSLSHWTPALAVGLVENGSCVVTQTALENHCDIAGVSSLQIRRQISALRNIEQVAISDAVFALDRDGNVHHIPLCPGDDYREVSQWRNIRRIVTGLQNAVFGITADGRVLCAGSNCKAGPCGDLQEKLSAYRGVTDICAMGAEGSQILLAFENGEVLDLLSGEHYAALPGDKGAVFHGNFLLTVFRQSDGSMKCIPYNYLEGLEKIGQAQVEAVAAGTDGVYPAFAVWTEK